MRSPTYMFRLLTVSCALLLVAMATAAQAGSEPIPSYKQLGHGRLSEIDWEARGEVTKSGRNGGGAEEVCVVIGVLERDEGSESADCGPPTTFAEEITRSQYGVIAAAMYPPAARRVLICEKGGREVIIPLKPVRLRGESAKRIRSYSYFARGFKAGTRIRRMSAVGAEGRSKGCGFESHPRSLSTYRVRPDSPDGTSGGLLDRLVAAAPDGARHRGATLTEAQS